MTAGALPEIHAGWLAYWLLGFGLVAFGAAEFYAIRHARGTAKGRATLSYNVHALARRHRAGHALVWFLLAWLAWHFTVGGGTRWWPDTWAWALPDRDP